MKLSLPKSVFVWIPVLMVVVAVPVALLMNNRKETDNNLQNADTITDTADSKADFDKEVENEAETDADNPAGTIVVEAGDGVLELAEYDSFSYVGESARGLEAYLASRGTSAIYSVEVPNDSQYEIWIKLSDDALHESGTRSATVVINDSQTLGYVHFSEDTNGWKWYKLGISQFRAGDNTVVFTKNETTSAAFVMDEFKLLPLESK